MGRIVAVLRWHVSRTGLSRRGREAVLIDLARGSDRCLETWNTLIDSPSRMTMDSFVWWTDTATAAPLKVETAMLMESLTGRNLLRDASLGGDARDSRSILEDMVFLQFLTNRRDFDRIWRRIGGDGFDPDPLVRLSSSRWIDFTRQARRAASTVYENLLKGSLQREERR